jgi:hypothetical protein
MGRTLFSIASVALLGWALMIFAPAWRVTRWLVRHELFPLFLVLLYAIGLFAIVFTGPSVRWNFGNVDNVLALLAREDVALVAWIHILAFDHLVGVVIFRDNAAYRYVPTVVQSLILFVTLFFGPLGYLIYYLSRLARGGARSREARV